MATKTPKSPILTAAREVGRDEAKAVAFFEARRWGKTPACPLCGSDAVYQMRDRKTGERNQDFRWRCRDCRKMYSVRTGMVLEETRLPLWVWVHAFWRGCASKKGVSALQISRECEISYKSALFLMHRIRLAMKEDPEGQPKLGGTVEADETYVGGKPRYTGKGGTGRGTKKTPVFAVVERGGRVRAKVVERVNAKTLIPAILEAVRPDARVITDEYPAYSQLRLGVASHETIHHGSGVYVRGDVTTNTVESFFALIKRGVYGTFHSVSKHHLPRYIDEFTFRYNARGLDDGERMDLAIKSAEGKRLVYRQPAEAAH